MAFVTLCAQAPLVADKLHDEDQRVRDAAVEELLALGPAGAVAATACVLPKMAQGVHDAGIKVLQRLGRAAADAG